MIDLDSSPANHVSSYATEEFLAFLARQGIPFEQFRAQRQPASIAHNQGETPFFAASIERAVLNNWCAMSNSRRVSRPERDDAMTQYCSGTWRQT
jgi:hypothetical protein